MSMQVVLAYYPSIAGGINGLSTRQRLQCILDIRAKATTTWQAICAPLLRAWLRLLIQGEKRFEGSATTVCNPFLVPQQLKTHVNGGIIC